TAWLWFALPAVSVFLLNAVTAHLTLDVMPLPLLWVVLLGLFLLSYVVGFSGKADRYLVAWQLLSALSVLAAALVHRRSGAGGGFLLNLSACLALCFFGATFLHTWLYAVRPQAGRLTLYYLGNAAGGAAGGLLASLAAPAVFSRVTEFPIAMALVAAAGVLYVFSVRGVPRGMRAVCVVMAVGALAAFAVSVRPKPGDRPVVWRARGFFGTLQVLEAKAKTARGEGVIREFVHGNTVHGIQALIPGKERMPTTYYTEQGCGYAVLGHPHYRGGKPMRVCLLGMGVGVMLSYARSNDVYRCYDISRDVVDVASRSGLFTFSKECLGRVEIVCQDARKGLEREEKGQEPLYDVIVLDALTGDNIPYHLSTREAFELYLKRLAPGGVLAVNISNWHLSLEPLMKALGNEFECPVLAFASANDFGKLAFASKTAFFCREPAKLGQPPKGIALLDLRRVKNMPLPTDEKGSFVNTIKWK
ncbi:MAG: fused MFS/spermidine synthase, partial [Kiritimatiellae bacterium]|nr:fused MFS/spermidine synthase [Kiritimatiellia bacterium]